VMLGQCQPVTAKIDVVVHPGRFRTFRFGKGPRQGTGWIEYVALRYQGRPKDATNHGEDET
jgi:hypothetical protein